MSHGTLNTPPRYTTHTLSASSPDIALDPFLIHQTYLHRAAAIGPATRSCLLALLRKQAVAFRRCPLWHSEHFYSTEQNGYFTLPPA